MARKSKGDTDRAQTSLLDVTGQITTGPCVPALREAVKAWRAGGYKGITDTTRQLLNFWFYTDHKLPNGRGFRYYPSQQEAIETLIFVWEYEKVRTRLDLLKRRWPWPGSFSMPNVRPDRTRRTTPGRF